MISLFIMPLSFLGYFLGASCFLTDLALIPVFVLSILGLLLYAGALLGFLLPLTTILLWSGLFGFLLFLAKKKNYALAETLTFLLLWTGFIAFVLKWYGQFEIETWDDFANWGYLAKFLYAENRLFDQVSEISFKHYPPGVALIEYYFTHQIGFSESNLLLGHLIIFWAGLVALASPLRTRPLLACAAILFSLILTEEMGYRLFDIYRDKILAVYFAVALSLVILHSQDEKKFFLILALVALLPLIKHVGLVFSLIIIATYGVDLGVDFYERKISSKDLKLFCLKFFMLLAAPFISFMSWKNYYRSLGVVDNYNASLDPLNIFMFFINPQEGKQIAIWQEFYQRAMTLKPFDLNYFTAWLPEFSALLIVTLLYIVTLPQDQRLRQGLKYFCVGAGSIAFLGLLLMSYAYYFDDYEGPRLASFERYINSYLLAWALIITISVFVRYSEIVKKFYYDLAPLIFIATLFIKDIKTYVEFIFPENLRQVQVTKLLRQELKDLVGKLNKQIKPSERVYFIDQNSNGMSFTVFRYESFPMKLNEGCWSVGNKYDKNDVWTCAMDIKEKLKSFDYLAIRFAERQFFEALGFNYHLESEKLSDAVFRIKKTEDNINFERID